jgi:YD repeat-containing protein
VTEVYNTVGTENKVTISRVDEAVSGLESWSYGQGLATPTHSVYNPSTRTRTVTNPDGSFTMSVNDANGRLSTVAKKDGNNAVISQTTYGYDGHGRVATATVQDGTDSARSRVTTTVYNNLDKPTTITVAGPGTPALGNVSYGGKKF